MEENLRYYLADMNDNINDVEKVDYRKIIENIPRVTQIVRALIKIKTAIDSIVFYVLFVLFFIGKNFGIIQFLQYIKRKLISIYNKYWNTINHLAMFLSHWLSIAICRHTAKVILVLLIFEIFCHILAELTVLLVFSSITSVQYLITCTQETINFTDVWEQLFSIQWKERIKKYVKKDEDNYRYTELSELPVWIRRDYDYPHDKMWCLSDPYRAA
jgi:hypothetical protein